jgi:DNA replication protein DnaC
MSRPSRKRIYCYPDTPESLEIDLEWEAYWASPEGQAEIADRKARRQARFMAVLPSAIEERLRSTFTADSPIGLPERALDIVLAGGLDETPALAAVRGAEDICILAGGCGVGKSIAAVAWVHDYVAAPERWQDAAERDQEPRPRYRGHVPLWIAAAQLARTDHFKQSEVDRVAKVKRLVIDDLGSEFSDSKGFFASLLDEVIDLRYSGQRPTIVTTNLDADAFRARYGVRIVDRIREAGRFVGCGNQSLRKRPTQ